MKVNVKNYQPNEIIRFIREWAELSQEDFGKSVNRTANIISDYERGIIHCSFNRFLKMCKEHNVEVIIHKNN